MKAVWNGQILAEADKDDLIFIERNWYFPPGSIKQEFFSESDTPYHCPWKGDCQYFDVNVNGDTNKDAAFSYPEPKDSAIAIVKKDFRDYVAFWRGVEVVE